MWIQRVQISTRVKLAIVVISAILLLLLTACDWEANSGEDGWNRFTTKSVDIEAIPSTAIAGKPIKLSITITKNITKPYRGVVTNKDLTVHELIGVCFKVDKDMGGFCGRSSTGEPVVTLLPPCIKLSNHAEIYKDLGTFNLSLNVPKVFGHELTFSCSEAKTVKVKLVILSNWIYPHLSTKWKYQSWGNSKKPWVDLTFQKP